MTDRVVIGWDGTAAAEEALEWALRHEPGCHGVELVVVDDGDQADELDGITRSAEGAADRIRSAHPDWSVTVATEHGAVESVLAARSGQGTLVVLGGADPLNGRHRSSTAYRVADEATGPVAMVPEGFDHGRDVVLGIGEAPAAPDVALVAADQAARRRQRLIAVHAWRLFADLDTYVNVDPQHDAQMAREREALLTASLKPVEDRYPQLPISRRVVHGRPIDAVLDAARTASLVVIGRDDAQTGRRARALTHRLMLSSRVPVLLVPGTAP